MRAAEKGQGYERSQAWDAAPLGREPAETAAHSKNGQPSTQSFKPLGRWGALGKGLKIAWLK
jgi:hypothetical protein